MGLSCVRRPDDTEESGASHAAVRVRIGTPRDGPRASAVYSVPAPRTASMSSGAAADPS